jgi:tRNA modification GTPase
MTPKAVGAISTIELAGPGAAKVIKKIFEPIANKPPRLATGRILLGHIRDGRQLIDEVVIGCEGPQLFAINCHGNPLIVQTIMYLLQRQGTALVEPEQILKHTLSARQKLSSIALEAKLAQLKTPTLLGTKIVTTQAGSGLAKTIASWLSNIDTTPLEKIAKEARTILDRSQAARPTIYGSRVILVGPPNSGKSTLLNSLCGRQKSIVTDIPGTTRDWVTATWRTGQISITFLDTAGLTETTGAGPADRTAQHKTIALLNEADLVLLVLDNSRSIAQLERSLVDHLTDKKVLTVLNKIDLPAKFDEKQLPCRPAASIRISALLGQGINDLLAMIEKTLSVPDPDLRQPLCFTPRQTALMQKLTRTDSKATAASVLQELLNGNIQTDWFSPHNDPG